MLKNTGMSRKIDELGRVVIPMEIRKKYNISEGDKVYIYVDDFGNIIFKKYERTCSFCGDFKNLKTYKDKPICKKCLNKINKINYID